METQFVPMSVKIGSVSRENAQDIVVGRDALADRLWQQLKRSSLQVLSERRMGKTWMLHLAHARQPDEANSVFLNVEALKSADEFTKRLITQIYGEIPATGKLQHARGLLRRGWAKVEGKTLGNMAVPEFSNWKERLEAALKTMQERVGDRMAVVILDELPHLLDSIIQADRDTKAIELLDALRFLRQEMPRLRMVYCGSLGFHIVFHKLQQRGYTGHPVNDMGTFEVPPLEPEGSRQLAGNLLLGEHVPCDNIEGVAGMVGQVAGHVPFYVQHIVQWMLNHNEKEWTPEAVRVVLAGIFDDVGDPAKFKYYDQRLDQHYPVEWVENARATLDLLSRDPEGLLLPELLNLIHHREKNFGLSQDDVLKVLDILRQDHYVIRRGDRYSFKLDIVRQWWHSTRGNLSA